MQSQQRNTTTAPDVGAPAWHEALKRPHPAVRNVLARFGGDFVQSLFHLMRSQNPRRRPQMKYLNGPNSEQTHTHANRADHEFRVATVDARAPATARRGALCVRALGGVPQECGLCNKASSFEQDRGRAERLPAVLAGIKRPATPAQTWSAFHSPFSRTFQSGRSPTES